MPKWTRKAAINPLVNHYVARDGRRMFFCLLEPVRDWQNLCRALEIPEWVEDSRFATPAARRSNSAELVARIDHIIATRDMGDWAAIFKRYDLVWGPVPPSSEVAHDPQMGLNGVFAEIEPGLKTVQNPLQIDGVEKAAPRMAPGIGEHTREVLLEIGYGEEEIAAMIERGAALANPL
jgi:crotonobetainyl-CoA:carnitine CoA-transferase CaiB-like acyl-CoA transferase